MKYKNLSLSHLLIFTFLFTLSISANAQFRTEPDPQIKQRMLEYLDRLETSSNSRQRVYQPAAIENAAYSRDDNDRGSNSSSSSAFALERRAFDLLNEQRALKGLSPLRWSDDLARVARMHSEDMARNHYFSHDGPDGSVNARAKSLGIRGWRSIGENIAFNKGFRKPVEMACQHWMTSPGHRDNILDRTYTDSGIGVAIAPDGSYYFTQVFIAR